MAGMISIRLDDKTRRTISRIARAKGRSQSEIVREAIQAFVRDDASEVPPYDQWKDVIGIIKGGPPDLSERTGEKFTRLLLERRKRRG
jgi:metal-responsive CopG/Arc/MetJ family transcriptional regulator